VDRSTVSPEEIGAGITADVLPKLRVKYPTMSIGMSGEQEERSKAFAGLGQAALLSLLVIYTLLAIPLRSYLQPLFIMLGIPFGYVGAVVGHLLTGTQLSMFSYIGVMACAGVVVNDSLVLVTFMNRLRDSGMSISDAAVQAGQSRFRAIMLTSITTFAGLTPIMLDQTAQAQVVIPMAVSLGFGVLIATVFTLLLVPSVILIAEDLKQGSRQITPRLAAAVRWLNAETCLGRDLEVVRRSRTPLDLAHRGLTPPVRPSGALRPWNHPALPYRFRETTSTKISL